jgi:hypothetical protein
VQSFLGRNRNNPFRRILIPITLFASLFVLYLHGLLFGPDGVHHRGYRAPPPPPPGGAITIFERDDASSTTVRSIPLHAEKRGDISSSSLTGPMPRSLADVVVANAEAAWRDRLRRLDIDRDREKEAQEEEEEERRGRMKVGKEGRRNSMAAAAATTTMTTTTTTVVANGIVGGVGREEGPDVEYDGRRASTDGAMAAASIPTAPRIDDSPSSSRRVVNDDDDDDDADDDASGSSEGAGGGSGSGSGRREVGGGGGSTTGPTSPASKRTAVNVGDGDAARGRRRTGALRGGYPVGDGGGGGGGGNARGSLLVLVLTCAVLRMCIDSLVSRVLGFRRNVADDYGDDDGDADVASRGVRRRRLPALLLGRMGPGFGWGGGGGGTPRPDCVVGASRIGDSSASSIV